MKLPAHARSVLCLIASALACLGASPARGAPARQYLDQAQAATAEIQLAGDQSAALQAIALTLVTVDPQAALGTVARMRRPSDAARALGAAAVAMAPNDPAAAAENIAAAGRLLMRIADPDQRLAEQRLLLREIAALGGDALPAGAELRPGEAQLAVILGRAERDAAGALALLREWELEGPPADEAAAAIAERMAVDAPEGAIEVASGIGSARAREAALWSIAERRPPQEAAEIALRVSDPIVRSAISTSAAVRMAQTDPEAALAVARMVEVASHSASAELAAALAAADPPRAVEMARGLPPRPRAWALQRIAVEVAGVIPELAETLLAEAAAGPDTVRAALRKMVRVDAGRAARIARSLPPGEGRDAVLAGLARELVGSNPALAKELLWEIESPGWRAEAVEPAAAALAESDCDAATALLGLVTEPERAGRIRARLAVVVAPRDPEMAARLLESLPPSDYRSDAALGAAKAVLSAGGQPEVASRLGAIGMEPDLALRWALPYLAYAETRSPIDLGGRIERAYPRALALVDVAREMLHLIPTARPAPERAREIRPIVEWEGRR